MHSTGKSLLLGISPACASVILMLLCALLTPTLPMTAASMPTHQYCPTVPPLSRAALLAPAFTCPTSINTVSRHCSPSGSESEDTEGESAHLGRTADKARQATSAAPSQASATVASKAKPATAARFDATTDEEEEVVGAATGHVGPAAAASAASRVPPSLDDLPLHGPPAGMGEPASSSSPLPPFPPP